MSGRSWGISESLCVLAVAAGLFLRFHRLDQPLWYDEAVSVKTAQLPLSQIPAELTSAEDANPPLYPLLLKGWLAVFRGSDSAIHALSAAIGTLAVASAGWAAWSLGGPAAGLLCAGLMAAHPWAISYSQEARGYELLVLIALWSCYFALAAAATGRRRDWLGFAAATAAGLYTHNYAAFLLLAQLGWLAWEERARPGRLKPALIAAAAALVLYAPWAGAALRQTRALPALPAVGWHDWLFSLYSGAGLWIMIGPLVCHWPPGFLPVWLAVDLAAAYYALKRLEDRVMARGLLAMACVTIAVPLLISAARPIYTTGRHNIVTLPALCLLAALALSRVERPQRLGLLALILGSFAYPTAAYFSVPKSFDRQIAQFLEARHKPGYEVLMFPVYRRVAIGHYYPAALEAQDSLSLRSEADLPPGLELMVEYPRVPAPAQRAFLEKFYAVEAEEKFGFSTVTVLAKRKARGQD